MTINVEIMKPEPEYRARYEREVFVNGEFRGFLRRERGQWFLSMLGCFGVPLASGLHSYERACDFVALVIEEQAPEWARPYLSRTDLARAGVEVPRRTPEAFDPFEDGGRVLGEIVALTNTLERSNSKRELLKALRKLKRILNDLDLRGGAA